MNKNYFFDRKLVVSKMRDKQLKALSRMGAFVRTRAVRSLRRRNKPSEPGTPPSVRSRDRYATLKNIQFSYDTSADSVVVGPIKIERQRKTRKTSSTVPQLHEFGGSVQAQGTLVPYKAIKIGNRKVTMKRKVQGTMKYPARPFMGPALLAEQPKMAGLFRGELG